MKNTESHVRVIVRWSERHSGNKVVGGGRGVVHIERVEDDTKGAGK